MIKVIYKNKKKQYHPIEINTYNDIDKGIKFIQDGNTKGNIYGLGILDIDRNVLYVSAMDKKHAKSQMISVAMILDLNVNIFKSVRIFPPFKENK